MRHKTLSFLLTLFISMVASVACADEHEYVDLGLSSGTLWATCNIGASSPEDYGNYYAWGETITKSSYSWSNYQWCNGTETTLTKYCSNNTYGYNGFTDNLTELLPEDDAAYVNWGSEWRMPTDEQITELRENCTWNWTKLNGVNGCRVTATNGKSIFLPAAGYCNESIYRAGSLGDYYSRTLNTYAPNGAYGVYFVSGGNYKFDDYRYRGRRVRPVRPKIPATGIVMNYDSYTIEGVGKNLQLEVAVQPENTTDKGISVTWKSFNESVCFVTNGLVISTGYGTTLVMVTTTDNRFMAYCAITVTDGTPVTDIEADKTDGAVYDLSGRQVTKPTRGIYIKDGKKMIAK